MKRFMVILFAIIGSITLSILIPVALLAQPDTLHVPIIPTVPPGFDFWYIPIFFVGMLFHFIVAMKNVAGGWSKIPWNTLFGAFVTWFFTDKHYTIIAGAVTAILGIVSTYELNVGFGTLNPLAIAAALAAGYIGDSAFNKAGKIQGSPGPTQ